jgi:5'-methylthioadenosine phosphorylase
VTLEEIISNLNMNTEHAQNVIREAVRSIASERACECGSALAHAIITDLSVISAAALKRLTIIAGKYLTPGVC